MVTPGDPTDRPRGTTTESHDEAIGALPAGSSRNRDLVRRLVIGGVVLFALAMFVLAGVFADTESDDNVTVSGDIVQRLIPARNDAVLRQSPVGVDLLPGWGLSTLTINGVAVPERDWDVTLPLELYQFVPGDGKTVERLVATENCVNAVVYQLADPTNTRTYDWCFTVN